MPTLGTRTLHPAGYPAPAAGLFHSTDLHGEVKYDLAAWIKLGHLDRWLAAILD